MADTYQITSDQGPIYISPVGELNPLSSLALTPDWSSADPHNPKTIFSWSNAYIFTWKLGSTYYYVKFQDREQQVVTTESGDTGAGYVYVFAYTMGNNPNDPNYFRVDAIWTTDSGAGHLRHIILREVNVCGLSEIFSFSIFSALRKHIAGILRIS